MKRRLRILYIENDLDDIELFREATGLLNFPTVCNFINNCYEALQHLAEHPDYDVVFLDLNMPSMNGFECMKHIKSRYQVPVIILSTSEDSMDMQRCKEAGASYYFTKSPYVEKLVDILKQVLTAGLIFL